MGNLIAKLGAEQEKITVLGVVGDVKRNTADLKIETHKGDVKFREGVVRTFQADEIELDENNVVTSGHYISQNGMYLVKPSAPDTQGLGSQLV